MKLWISWSTIFLCSAICHSHTDGTGQFNTQPEPGNKPLIRRLEDGPLYPPSHSCETHCLNILNKASISPLPHILTDLDHHTLGSAGSLLYSVLLFPSHLYFCKIRCLFILVFSFLLLIILYGLPSSELDRRLCGLGTTWQCPSLLSSPPGSTHFVYIIKIVSDILLLQFVNSNFVVLSLLFIFLGLHVTSTREPVHLHDISYARMEDSYFHRATLSLSSFARIYLTSA